MRNTDEIGPSPAQAFMHARMDQRVVNHKIPMLLDDAAGIPPVENAKLYARMGIDLYCFSGGKGLCGPQCSGLLLGRKDLIEAALLNCSPREGAVCRPMKVGKEEVIGCLTALETWLKLDEKKLYADWNGRLDRIRPRAAGANRPAPLGRGRNRDRLEWVYGWCRLIGRACRGGCRCRAPRLTSAEWPSVVEFLEEAFTQS